MPDIDNEPPGGIIQADEGRLPAPTRASEDEISNMADTPGLSDEDLDARQRRLGTRRKPAGPTDDGIGALDGAVEVPSDVPETDVQEAVEIDPERFDPDNPDDGGNDDGGLEPLESSERD